MPVLRTCSLALANALASGVKLWSADLFRFTLVDGTTVFRWTSWDVDLSAAGYTYSSRKPWLQRSKWNVNNTMEVPTLTVYLRARNDAFNGGASIKAQIHNGLFDGCSFLLSRAYMVVPGGTSALGTIDLFGGEVAGLDLIGNQVTLKIKGKVNRLDQQAPRNLYQLGCNHAFCSVGCTLNRVSFTTTYQVGATPSLTFIPWSGAAPSSPLRYRGGTLALTSGAAAGGRRNIVAADGTGLTLSYPLFAQPMPGDTFTAFEGCDKTFNSGSGQSCTDHSNTQHHRGFEFVPPPNAAY